MDCPRCQHDNPVGQKFCGECGTSLRATSEGSRPGTSYAELQRDLSEAREQQTASAEILRVLSSSPADVQPVFDTIVNSAPRLCGAKFCILYRYDGELLHLVAHHNVPGMIFWTSPRLRPAAWSWPRPLQPLTLCRTQTSPRDWFGGHAPARDASD
jgi:Double zinc ribbon